MMFPIEPRAVEHQSLPQTVRSLCLPALLVSEITAMSGYRQQCWDFRGAVSEPLEVCAEEKRVSKNGAANGKAPNHTLLEWCQN